MRTTEYKAKAKTSTTWGAVFTDKVVTYEVESAFDLMDEEMPKSTEWNWNYKFKERRHSGWFNGELKLGHQVIEAVKNITPDIYEGTLKKLKQLKAPANKKAVAREMKRKRKRSRGDMGNEVDIHAVRQGHADTAWTKMKFVERSVHGSKHVHLVVNCSMHSGIKPYQAEWRSAMLIAVHDELVRLGKSVSISLTWPSQGCFDGDRSHNLYHFYAPIKNSNEMMSQRHLAAYTSAAFTRLFMLSRFHNLPGRRVSGGYGRPASLSYDTLPFPVKRQLEMGQHIVLLHACFDKENAERTIEKVVKQIQDADTGIEKESTEQLLGGFRK
jgi:hypothetical protein